MSSGERHASSVAPDRLVAGWHITIGQATGPGHDRSGRGCEDRCGWAEVRPGVLLLAVADGAGSRRRSAEGAEHAVSAAGEAAGAVFGRGIPGSRSDWLSRLERLRTRTFELFDERIKAAIYAQDDSAASADDYGTTLCTLVITPAAIGYLSVGDAFAAVWRDPGGPHLVVPPPLDREHAGLTTFLTSASREQAARSGLIEDDRIVGVALSTDGLLDALLRLDTNSRVGPHWVAPLDFEHYFKRSASGAFDGDALNGVLASRRFASTSDDDKTLLLAVRT
jgi:hypothetical protein